MHPVNAARQRVVGCGVMAVKRITKTHNTVCGRATTSAGNGNLGFKKAAVQGTGAGRYAVFSHGDGCEQTIRTGMNHSKYKRMNRWQGLHAIKGENRSTVLGLRVA
jgi:hypothetical protein